METTLGPQSEIDLAAAELLEQPHVLAALLATRDGLPLAAVTSDNEIGDPDAWAAVAATLGHLARQLSLALHQGSLASAVFRAEQRCFLVRPLPVGFVVVVTDGALSGPTLETAIRGIERATWKLTGGEGE